MTDEARLDELFAHGTRAWWAARWHIVHKFDGLVAMQGDEARAWLASTHQTTQIAGLAMFNVTYPTREQADLTIAGVQAYAAYLLEHTQ